MRAVILAGGKSRRLGGVPKAGLLLDGRTLLARTVDAAAGGLAASAARASTARASAVLGGAGTQGGIAVVGPQEMLTQWLAGAGSDAGVVCVQEDPPYSGPAAGIAAGLDAFTPGTGTVLVLACDMPRVARLVAELVEGLGESAGSVMATDGGRRQPLAGIYREEALREAIDAARAGKGLVNASVFSLLASVNCREVAVASGLTADIDTWDDALAQGIDSVKHGERAGNG